MKPHLFRLYFQLVLILRYLGPFTCYHYPSGWSVSVSVNLLTLVLIILFRPLPSLSLAPSLPISPHSFSSLHSLQDHQPSWDLSLLAVGGSSRCLDLDHCPPGDSSPLLSLSPNLHAISLALRVIVCLSCLHLLHVCSPCERDPFSVALSEVSPISPTQRVFGEFFLI